MRSIDISALNLNLLPALDALLAERSVSRAARRMGVSQPAMSHTLARLRHEFGDPLLVLSGRRMELTPRAVAIATPLSEALRSLAASLAPGEPFDPRTVERVFSVATYDLFELALLPQLLAYLATEAPSLSLRIERVTTDTVDRLQRGALDLLLCSSELALPSSGLETRRLEKSGFAVVARRGRGQRPTMRQYLDATHILVSLDRRSEGVVDRALAAKGKRRKVTLVVPHFMSALALAASSDSLLTLPVSAAERGVELFDLSRWAPPLPLPQVTSRMVWPSRFRHDEGHRWLRDAMTRGGLSGSSARARKRKSMGG